MFLINYLDGSLYLYFNDFHHLLFKVLILCFIIFIQLLVFWTTSEYVFFKCLLEIYLLTMRIRDNLLLILYHLADL